ncbi:MAG TPA: OpgC domain-containing protein [Stellaceae bacterium]|nr:OpgC domain-containing protein [Stellaceae bacterium]
MPAPARTRDLRLDFFRGVALVFIFVDHIPENILSYFTLQAVGFYDAAEVFIFISGFTAALVYGQRLVAKGALYATAQIWRRAWQLYVAHVFLFVIFIGEVSYTVMTFNNPMYNEEMRVADFLVHPHIAVIKALLLEFQPTFLDILPLYILMMLIFPAILVSIRRRPLLVVAASFLLYLAVQILGLSVPAYPEGATWYFNPMAWQFLFIAGAVLGQGAARGVALPVLSRALMPVAIVVLLAAMVVRLSWTIAGVWDGFPTLLLKELWPVDKTDLSPIRLVPFLATVVLVAAWVKPDAAFLQTRAARPLVRAGAQSLEVFCLGIVLSALGHFILAEYASGLAMQVAVNVVGIGAMLLTARMLDWYKAMDRAPAPRPAMVTRPGRGDEAPL